MDDGTNRVLEVIAHETPLALEREFDRIDVCILGTKVALGVCRYFGVNAKPIVVEAAAYNPAAAEWLRAHGPARNADDIRELEQAGGWLVQIDTESTTPGRFPGHVCLVAGDRLVDTTLGQLSRPARGIVLPKGGVFEWTDSACAYTVNECLLIYAEVPKLRTYTKAHDWRRSPDRTIGSVIGAVRERLNEPSGFATVGPTCDTRRR